MTGVYIYRRPQGLGLGQILTLILAALLHVLVFLLVTLQKPANHLPPVGSAVPINLVTSAPPADAAPTIAAPEVQAPSTPEPVEAAPPAPPPAPPKPAPPQPTPAPAPAARTPPAKPLPVKPEAKPVPPGVTKPAAAPAAPARPSLDLDRLQTAINHAAQVASAKPSSAPRGPPRPPATVQAHTGQGTAATQSDIEGLSQLLNRLWLKNCNGGGIVDVTVRLTVDADGRVTRADAGGLENSPNAVIYASARRAIDAVHVAAPYAVQFRSQTFQVNFIATKACSNS